MANNESDEKVKSVDKQSILNLLTIKSKEELEAGRRLFSSNVSFIAGSVNMDSLPIEGVPEIAFAGRSNVGKSSLINSITNRKTLARTSQNPGRTQQINFFEFENKELRLVDFPGFGYAKASKKSIEKWTRLIHSYLRYRTALKRVLLLIDSRRGISPLDEETMKVLDKSAVSYQIILTKIDKLKIKELEELIVRTEKNCIKHPAAHPSFHLTSSLKGIGIQELKAEIASLLTSHVQN